VCVLDTWVVAVVPPEVICTAAARGRTLPELRAAIMTAVAEAWLLRVRRMKSRTPASAGTYAQLKSHCNRWAQARQARPP
jgi:hypothetical protein